MAARPRRPRSGPSGAARDGEDAAAREALARAEARLASLPTRGFDRVLARLSGINEPDAAAEFVGSGWPGAGSAVALLLPEPLDVEVDALRRACGDPMLERVRPHVTLVPPVNVRAGPGRRGAGRAAAGGRGHAPRSPWGSARRRPSCR